MIKETMYEVRWKTNREHEKNRIFKSRFLNLKDALEFKKDEESIKENIEVKIFEVKIREI